MLSENEKIENLKLAFMRAIENAGNVHQLHIKTGVSEASLNRYNSGKQAISNIPFATLIQLFPFMRIDYFGDGSQHKMVQTTSSTIESQLLQIFRSLSYDEQIRCLTVVAANFGDKIREETKKNS